MPLQAISFLHKGGVASYANAVWYRARRFWTVGTCHRPPLAVRIPRAFRTEATSRIRERQKPEVPARWATHWRQIGPRRRSASRARARRPHRGSWDGGLTPGAVTARLINEKPSPAFTGEGEGSPPAALCLLSEHAPGLMIRLSLGGHRRRKAPAMGGPRAGAMRSAGLGG
jgi:hypothetical protein